MLLLKKNHWDKNKEFWICLLISILISLIVYHRWLNFFIFANGDYTYFFVNSLRDRLHQGPWLTYSDLGRFNLFLWRAPYNYLYGLASLFQIQFSIQDKILLFWPIILLSGSAGYIFIYSQIRSAIPALLGSFIISYNTYYLSISTQGHLLIIIGGFVSLFTLTQWIKACEIPTIKSVISSSLLLTVVGVLDFRVAYITAGLMFTYLAFYLINEREINKLKVRNFLAVMFLFVVFNFFWLIPTFFSSSLTQNEIVSRGLFGSKFFNISASLSNFFPFWTGKEPIWFEVQQISLSAYAITFLCFVGFIIGRRKPIVIYYCILALIGILLSKQVGAPFEDLYPLMYSKVPGFNAFREASKFYFLTIIGFAFLMSVLVKRILEMQTKYKYLMVGMLAILLLWNTKPLVNGEIKSLYIKRSLAEDYSKLNQYLTEQDDFFRTVWVPTSSKWGPFNSFRPMVSLNSLGAGTWKKILDYSYDDTLNPLATIHPLSFNIANKLFDSAMIKYFIVPVKSFENADDVFTAYGGETNPEIRNWYISKLDQLNYLNRIDIGTDNLVIYENSNSHAFISTHHRLLGFEKWEKSDYKNEFGEKIGGDHIFTIQNTGSNITTTNINGFFTDITHENIQSDGIHSSLDKKGTAFYENIGKKTLFYTLSNGVLDVFAGRLGNLRQGNSLVGLGTDIRQNIYRGSIANIDQTYIQLGTRLIQLQASSTPKRFGNAITTDLVREVGPNAIINPSFESGFWTEEVGDCNAYDTNPILGMNIQGNKEGEGKYLELAATRHIACTSQKQIPVTSSGNYVFSFDYQSANGKQVGYYMSFNDPLKSIIAERIPVVDTEWQKFRKYLKIPEGATSVTLVIYSYSLDEKSEVITRYDNFVLRPLQKLETITYDYEPTFEKLPIEISDKYSFVYSDNITDLSNQIINPSFEEGLWQKDVGDCNAYDRHPVLEMRLVEGKTYGEKALELGATRHIACTGPGVISVNGGSTYLLSFDYQSPNGIQAGYYLGFSGTENAAISERIPIVDKEWHTYVKQIYVPEDATSASLVLYSYSEDGVENIKTLYDDFHLIELPDFANRYYLIEDNDKKFVNPKETSFEIISPSKKLVHVKGATTPFYVAMSESYHDQWQLQFNNGKNHGILQGWIPFISPNRIPDEQHFELNGFLNGWYVDVRDYCEQQELCTKNSDGSYDIEFVIEFFPQRWFYLGMLLSGSALAGCIAYLIIDYRKRKTFSKKHVSA